MTEKIKSAIKYGDDYYKDLISTCCDVSDRHKDYIKMANNSLKAWEEVLNDLEILIRGCDIMLEDTDNDIQSVLFYGGKKRAYEKVIEVINQKLAEVEK